MNKEDIVRLIRKSGKPSAGLDEALTKKVPDFSRTFNVGGRNRTRTCDPIDVNDVLYQLSHATMRDFYEVTSRYSHHGRNYKPLSKPGSLSNPLFSMVAATLAHLHNSRNWLVYPSVYPVHNSRTQAYTKPAVHKNGHQILLWCRHSISNEIQVMYNALYLIHFTVAEAKLKFR